MTMQPICEPVELPLGVSAVVARVVIPPGAPPVARMLHFHDVAEIVLFGDANGRFVCEGQAFPITPGCAVFAPTMAYHDFQFDDGVKEWTLIQFDPYVVQRLAEAGEVTTPVSAFCAQPDPATAHRVALLANWLADVTRADDADPLVDRIVELILMALCRLPAVHGDRQQPCNGRLARFLPAVERLRQRPGDRLTLKDAATLCHVSPAYFSRQFADVFGCGFADYVLSYRLHMASRRIATTTTPLSEIGFSLGFSSHSHFTARFRERFGLAPREYRRRVGPVHHAQA